MLEHAVSTAVPLAQAALMVLGAGALFSLGFSLVGKLLRGASLSQETWRQVLGTAQKVVMAVEQAHGGLSGVGVSTRGRPAGLFVHVQCRRPSPCARLGETTCPTDFGEGDLPAGLAGASPARGQGSRLARASPARGQGSRLAGASPAPGQGSRLAGASPAPGQGSRLAGASLAPGQGPRLAGASPAPGQGSRLAGASLAPGQGPRLAGPPHQKQDLGRRRQAGGATEGRRCIASSPEQAPPAVSAPRPVPRQPARRCAAANLRACLQ